jgi:hypothetical protein
VETKRGWEGRKRDPYTWAIDWQARAGSGCIHYSRFWIAPKGRWHWIRLLAGTIHCDYNAGAGVQTPVADMACRWGTTGRTAKFGLGWEEGRGGAGPKRDAHGVRSKLELGRPGQSRGVDGGWGWRLRGGQTELGRTQGVEGWLGRVARRPCLAITKKRALQIRSAGDEGSLSVVGTGCPGPRQQGRTACFETEPSQSASCTFV